MSDRRVSYLTIRLRVDSRVTVCPDQPETSPAELLRRVQEALEDFTTGLPRPAGEVHAVHVEEVSAEFQYPD